MKILLFIPMFLLIFMLACAGATTITQTVTETQAEKITQTVSVTEIQAPTPTVGQLLDIPVEPAPQVYLAGMVRVQNTQVRLGTCDQPNSIGIYTSVPCFVVTGTVTNEDDTAWQLGFSANGYSSGSSEAISHTLDYGPITGVLALIIPAEQSQDFTIHLSFNENVNLIRISGSLYSTEVPLP